MGRVIVFSGKRWEVVDVIENVVGGDYFGGGEWRFLGFKRLFEVR